MKKILVFLIAFTFILSSVAVADHLKYATPTGAFITGAQASGTHVAGLSEQEKGIQKQINTLLSDANENIAESTFGGQFFDKNNDLIPIDADPYPTGMYNEEGDPVDPKDGMSSEQKDEFFELLGELNEIQNRIRLAVTFNLLGIPFGQDREYPTYDEPSETSNIDFYTSPPMEPIDPTFGEWEDYRQAWANYNDWWYKASDSERAGLPKPEVIGPYNPQDTVIGGGGGDVIAGGDDFGTTGDAPWYGGDLESPTTDPWTSTEELADRYGLCQSGEYWDAATRNCKPITELKTIYPRYDDPRYGDIGPERARQSAHTKDRPYIPPTPQPTPEPYSPLGPQPTPFIGNIMPNFLSDVFTLGPADKKGYLDSISLGSSISLVGGDFDFAPADTSPDMQLPISATAGEAQGSPRLIYQAYYNQYNELFSGIFADVASDIASEIEINLPFGDYSAGIGLGSTTENGPRHHRAPGLGQIYSDLEDAPVNPTNGITQYEVVDEVGSSTFIGGTPGILSSPGVLSSEPVGSANYYMGKSPPMFPTTSSVSPQQQYAFNPMGESFEEPGPGILTSAPSSGGATAAPIPKVRGSGGGFAPITGDVAYGSVMYWE